tara:strand:+ start:1413 stop:3593 length:2181 start_codon:yes stop_codon:yes gene_type:complete
MSKNIPQSYLCCITQQLMNDPVIDNEGNSYERTAIMEWLSKQKTSPITRSPLTSSQLKPNRALKDAIEDYKRGYSETKETKETVESSHKHDMSIVDIKCQSNENILMLECNNPEGVDRLSVDIVLLLDASGSMGSEATVTNSSGQKESHGLTLLDIVKHGSSTIINCLGSGDRVCIVSYSDNAIVEYPLNYMTEENKKEALTKLESITTRGCTNIWNGLEESMKILDYNKNINQRCVFLLTDGQPNIVPPRGHIPMLERFMDKHPECCNINTYGFGYSVDSKLLNDLAKYGNGGYYMIPDSGFIGTIFEHSFANLVTSFTSNVSIKVENLEDNKLVSAKNTYTTEEYSWGKIIKFGPLQYGQTKNFILEFEKPLTHEQLKVVIEFKDYRTNTKFTSSIKNQSSIDNSINVHYLRSNMLSTIENCMNLLENYSTENATVANSILDDYISTIRTFETVFPNTYLSDLIKDLSGQTTLAFSNQEWYTRWGCHYIRSLTLAHMNQQCNNFKDPGVQHFGGFLFSKIRDHADEVFCNLPPPKPTARMSRSVPVASMRQYSNSSTPCFHGNCMVTMSDGKYKKVSMIKKGDTITTASGKIGTIRCVVKTIIPKGKLPMVGFNSGLLVTEWHPIRIHDIWCLPKTVGDTDIVNCDYIYSFLLEENDEPIMLINNIECITLAHKLNGDIVSHQYYGTDKIVEDLKKKEGWDEGLVILEKQIFQRDSITNMVTGI